MVYFHLAALAALCLTSSVVALPRPRVRPTEPTIFDYPDFGVQDTERRSLSLEDIADLSRYAEAASAAYCRIDRRTRLEPTTTQAHFRLPGGGRNSLRNILVSSADIEYQYLYSGQEPDLHWYIAHNPETATLTLAFSSLPDAKDVMSRMAAPAKGREMLVHPPDWVYPDAERLEAVDGVRAPRIHYAFLSAAETHGSAVLLAVLDQMESPHLSNSRSKARPPLLTGVDLDFDPEDDIENDSPEAYANLHNAPITKIEITGHGLGATTALLVAAGLWHNLPAEGIPPVDISVVLFASPPVGDAAFVEWIDSLQTVSSPGSRRLTSWENRNFIVSRVVSRGDPLSHFGLDLGDMLARDAVGLDLGLMHPDGEIWISPSNRVYACPRSRGYDNPACSASVGPSQLALADHAGPYAGVWIDQRSCVA